MYNLINNSKITIVLTISFLLLVAVDEEGERELLICRPWCKKHRN